MEADCHDRVLAATSHLPFLVASSLALGLEKANEALTGPGLRSTTRLASTPASMMLDVLTTNRENILEKVRQFRSNLDLLSSALEAGEHTRPCKLFGVSKQKPQIINLVKEIVIDNSSLSPQLEITPIPKPLKGSVRVPGSKSITNRALLLSALSKGKTVLLNALFSDDTLVFGKALKTLGYTVDLDENERRMEIMGMGGVIPVSDARLDVGNAGTAARFLTALAALGNGEFVLDGSPRIRERPIGELVQALALLGVDIEQVHANDIATHLPLRINASGLAGGRTKISGKTSSQFLSALLMAAPYATQLVEIEVTDELSSQPYISLTIKMMEAFGVRVENKEYKHFRIRPAVYASPGTYPIESDASSASYFFAAPAICGGFLTVENISLSSSQGDIAFLEVLAKMGCGVSERNKYHHRDRT